MSSSLRAQLHYGRVDIGCLQAVGPCRARASFVHQARRSFPGGFNKAFHGQPIAPALTGRPHGRPADRARQCPVKTSAIFGLFRGDTAEKTRKKYQAEVDAINKLEPQMQKLSDEELAEKTHALKQKAQSSGSVDALLVEAFAVRTFRKSLDTQIVCANFLLSCYSLHRETSTTLFIASQLCPARSSLHSANVDTCNFRLSERPPSVSLACVHLMSSS